MHFCQDPGAPLPCHSGIMKGPRTDFFFEPVGGCKLLFPCGRSRCTQAAHSPSARRQAVSMQIHANALRAARRPSGLPPSLWTASSRACGRRRRTFELGRRARTAPSGCRKQKVGGALHTLRGRARCGPRRAQGDFHACARELGNNPKL